MCIRDRVRDIYRNDWGGKGANKAAATTAKRGKAKAQ